MPASAQLRYTPAARNAERQWADSLLRTLSLSEKIGQLFMIPAYSNKDAKHVKDIETQIQKYGIGGIIFMQGTVSLQLNHLNIYSAASKVPLLVGQDAEWGVSMRLENVPKLPRSMTLGAIRNDSLLYKMGREMARQCRLAGANVDFAPVFDVNNNSNNPVINYRSFGEDKYAVTTKALMIAKGLEDGGVLACAKHFPGHGDTETDSHRDMPMMLHSRMRLDSLELFPFRAAIQAGIGSFMVAHLCVPSLDSLHQPCTVSPKVVQQLLRDTLKYEGLVFTDALNMKGISKFYEPGEAAFQALLAGNDMLMFPDDIPKTIELIYAALQSGKMTEQDIDKHVHRILEVKYRLGLRKAPKIRYAEEAQQQMETPASRVLRKQLYEAALTLAKNDDNILPVKDLTNEKIAYVQIGGSPNGIFQTTMQKYTEVTPFFLPKNAPLSQQDSLLTELERFSLVILGVFDMSQFSAKGFGLGTATAEFCRKVPNRKVLTLFGSPYSLTNFGTENAILVGYEEVPEMEQAAATAIMGGLAVSGKLPVSANADFKAGKSYILPFPIRLGFSQPEEEGMSTDVLNKIDSLANYYINTDAMPGCEVLVARGNNIVYAKGFGATTSTVAGEPINPLHHIYDLASVTKISATTLIAMQLAEQGKLNIDATVETYLPELKSTNKGNIVIRRLLMHNAGLVAWKPFYQDTYSNSVSKTPSPRYYNFFPVDSFTSPIATGFYSVASLRDSVWQWIIKTEVKNTTEVKYSDLGMIIVGRILERITGQSLDIYTDEHFYRSLGMNNTTFRPAQMGKLSQCPPTEIDIDWRHCTVQGYVHDQTCAMLGGVSGHAGLFSNIFDMAKLGMMLKNGGTYGNLQYLTPQTLTQWTSKQPGTYRRGLGFDKPEMVAGKESPTSDYASAATYGHTGFTGICLWIDPVKDLMFIFLSNRTYPTANNRRLIQESVRTKMMDEMYRAIKFE